MLAFFLTGRSIVRLRLRSVSRHFRDYWLIFTTGLPTVCRQGLGSVASAVLNMQAVLYGDAAVSAIKKLINEKVVLSEFLMQAITRGSNDVGRVHVQVECGSRTVHGFAAHTDTTRASIEAFLDALRALNVTEKREEEA